MKSQNELVLHHLRNHGSITTLIAFKRYHCTRLAARILDLQKEGHTILHTPVQRNGRRYVAYSLVEYGKKAA